MGCQGLRLRFGGEGVGIYVKYPNRSKQLKAIQIYKGFHHFGLQAKRRAPLFHNVHGHGRPNQCSSSTPFLMPYFWHHSALLGKDTKRNVGVLFGVFGARLGHRRFLHHGMAGLKKQLFLPSSRDPGQAMEHCQSHGPSSIQMKAKRTVLYFCSPSKPY